MSIQERNRYKKEIDILINRLSILQEQEKGYKDLTKEIDKLRMEEKALKKTIEARVKTQKELESNIKEKKGEITNIESEISRGKNEINKLKGDKDKEITEFEKQRILLNNTLDNIYTKIQDFTEEKKRVELECIDTQKELDGLIKQLSYKEKDVLEGIEKNKAKILKQEKEILEQEKNIQILKKEYNEMDDEYQKLIENYIVKT